MKVKTIYYKNTKVSYHDQGQGACMVFLHGYLENRRIWDPFLDYFKDTHRVLCMDIPGHGDSGVWAGSHLMDDLARALMAILNEEGIDRIWLIGHSMGGYVSMAFADLFPHALQGYVLFHSTCFADNEEKKLNRDREIALLRCGKMRQIVTVNIPRAFSDGNLDKFSTEVLRAQEIAFSVSDEGCRALLEGMKHRPDRSQVLSDPSLRLLIIGGMRDNYISAEVFEKLCALAPHARVCRLKESGHMGFIEEPEASARAIGAFMEGN